MSASVDPNFKRHFIRQVLLYAKLCKEDEFVRYKLTREEVRWEFLKRDARLLASVFLQPMISLTHLLLLLVKCICDLLQVIVAAVFVCSCIIILFLVVLLCHIPIKMACSPSGYYWHEKWLETTEATFLCSMVMGQTIENDPLWKIISLFGRGNNLCYCFRPHDPWIVDDPHSPARCVAWSSDGTIRPAHT